MAGVAVAVSGVIGFVGLVVPHIVRLMVGSDHRRVLPVGVLFGASFMVLGDLLARTIVAPQEMPIGVITAFIGAPTLIFLIRRRPYLYGARGEPRAAGPVASTSPAGGSSPTSASRSPTAASPGCSGRTEAGSRRSSRPSTGSTGPSAGRVLLDGADLLALRPRDAARRVAVVAQEFALEFDFTVAEMVMIGRTPHKRAFDRDDETDRAIVGSGHRAGRLRGPGPPRLQHAVRRREAAGADRPGHRPGAPTT